MSIEIKVGEKMPLINILSNYEGETQYVRATLYDLTKTPIGSPVTLTDQGGGEHCDFSVNMPNENFVSVIYEVFDDAGFTTPSSIYSTSNEIYTKAPADAVDAITGLIPPNLKGSIKTNFNLKGTLTDVCLL